jgi:hypothetical protein
LPDIQAKRLVEQPGFLGSAGRVLQWAIPLAEEDRLPVVAAVAVVAVVAVVAAELLETQM